VQPGGICVHVVHREPTPGGPGPGLRRGRKRFLCQLPLWFYIYLVKKKTSSEEAPDRLMDASSQASKTARRQSGCRCSTCGSAGGLRCGGRKRRSSLASQLHQPNQSTSERACIVGTTQTQPLPTIRPRPSGCPVATNECVASQGRGHRRVASDTNRGRRLPTGAASAHFSLFSMASERHSKERRHAMEALTRRCQGYHFRVPTLNQSERCKRSAQTTEAIRH
jgi:hypothetical protein